MKANRKFTVVTTSQAKPEVIGAKSTGHVKALLAQRGFSKRTIKTLEIVEVAA